MLSTECVAYFKSLLMVAIICTVVQSSVWVYIISPAEDFDGYKVLLGLLTWAKNLKYPEESYANCWGHVCTIQPAPRVSNSSQSVRVALLQCRVVTRLACFRESIPDIRICFLRILSDAECKTRKNAWSKYHHRWSKCYHTFAHCTAKTFLNRGPLMLMNY